MLPMKLAKIVPFFYYLALIIGINIPFSVRANTPEKLAGYWNINGNDNIVKIQRNESGVFTGTLIKVNDIAYKLGYRKNDIILKDIELNNTEATFKAALRPEDPKLTDICGIQYLPFIGKISNNSKRIKGNWQSGEYKFSEDANHKIIDCTFIPSDEPVPLEYIRDNTYEPKVNIVTINNTETVAIGETFTVEVEVMGDHLGRQTNVDVMVGGYQVQIPVYLIDETTGAFSNHLPELAEGPHNYQSKPINIIINEQSVIAEIILAKITGTTTEVEISGLTPLVTLGIIDSSVQKVIAAENMVDTIIELEKLLSFLMSIDSAELYEYAAASLIASLENSNSREIIAIYIDNLVKQSESVLNLKLDKHLTQSVKDMVDDGWFDNNNLKASIVQKAMALLKRVAIADTLNRLTELTQWKKGSGLIKPNTYLAYSPSEAITILGKMGDDDDAESFSQTNGIANTNRLVDKHFNLTVKHAESIWKRLVPIWDSMNKNREKFKEAEAQFDILFDWSSTRAKYAERYINAETGYKSLLADFQILAVIIEDKNGDEIPLWKAIIDSSTRRQMYAYITQAISIAEEQLQSMLGKLIEMRNVDDLIELASPRYSNLHTKAASLGPPMAKELVELAITQYATVKGNRAFYGALTDLGVWIGYGIGVFIPPFAYAAAAVDVSHSSTNAMLAYHDSSSGETSANVGFGSVLEVDKATLHFRNALGYVALDSIFAYGDLKALKQLRKGRVFKKGFEFDTVKSLKSREGVKALATADAKYFNELNRLKNLATKQGRHAEANIARMNNTQREIRKLKGPKNKTKRAELRKERDLYKKRSQDQLRYQKNNLQKAANLKKQRFNAGRNSELPKNYKAREGTYVEGLVNAKLKRVFDLDTLGKANTKFYSQMYILKKGHYMFGPKVRPIKMIRIKTGSTTKWAPKLRYEIRTKGRIKNTDGSYVKPPKEIEIPGRGKVKTGYDDASQWMEYDRIIFDHQDELIYVEDLIRTANDKHLIKTWAYARSLKVAFPNYNTSKIPLKNGKTWPRDIVYSDMKDLVINLKPNLKQYPLLKGKKVW